MKKITSILSCLFILFSLCACRINKPTEVYCPECDEIVVEGYSFCGNCGAELKENTNEASTSQNIENISATESTSEDKSYTENSSIIESITLTTEESYIKPSETEAPIQNISSSSDDDLDGYTKCEKCGTYFQGYYSYCSTCRCSQSNCQNLKSNNSDRWCSEHMCLINGCLTGRENGSLYCQNHNCDANSCKEAQSSNSRYCLQHKCTECSKQKESGSNYCSSHNCNWSNCKADKSNNSSYCIEHKCNQSGCSNSKQSSGESNYCSSHDCNYCMKDRYAGSSYCVDHKCSVSGCTNHGNNGIGGVMYCSNHLPD